jgi:hypothetical protein
MDAAWPKISGLPPPSADGAPFAKAGVKLVGRKNVRGRWQSPHGKAERIVHDAILVPFHVDHPQRVPQFMQYDRKQVRLAQCRTAAAGAQF